MHKGIINKSPFDMHAAPTCTCVFAHDVCPVAHDPLCNRFAQWIIYCPSPIINYPSPTNNNEPGPVNVNIKCFDGDTDLVVRYRAVRCLLGMWSRLNELFRPPSTDYHEYIGSLSHGQRYLLLYASVYLKINLWTQWRKRNCWRWVAKAQYIVAHYNS